MSDKAFVEWVNIHNVLSHHINWSTKYLVDQYYETVIIPARLKAERERVKLSADKCYTHTCEYFSPECERHFAGIYCSWWQQLKQEASHEDS